MLILSLTLSDHYLNIPVMLNMLNSLLSKEHKHSRLFGTSNLYQKYLEMNNIKNSKRRNCEYSSDSKIQKCGNTFF
jgi:hypothetical protein